MNARQRDFEKIGATGCYFLSIVYVAERYVGKYLDAYNAYIAALKAGIMRDDCFVLDPAALLRMLTGVAWSVTKEDGLYAPQKGEQVILRYERADTMSTTGHFVVAGIGAGVEYDPYGDSQTVRKGKMVSKRIFRRV